MNSDKTPPVRDDLAGMEGYVSPQLPARYRMNTNESPFPPPPELLVEVGEMLGSLELNRYPDRDARALFESLEGATGHPRAGLWIANGSNEILLHLLLAYGGAGRVALTFEPTYQLHSLIARISGTQVRHVQRDPSTFEVVLEEARAGGDVVFFCHPNNPTGALESRDAIAAAARAGGLVVVDEAYIEFAERDDTVADMLSEYTNLVIVRTFSKAWSLAGVRLGYLMASTELVEGLHKVRLPYHLSSFAQAAGVAALGHAEASSKRIGQIVAQREALSRGLDALGLQTYPSRANFVLFRVEDSERTWKGLYERGVLVRNYPGNQLLENHLRVTATTPEETKAFLDALKEVI